MSSCLVKEKPAFSFCLLKMYFKHLVKQVRLWANLLPCFSLSHTILLYLHWKGPSGNKAQEIKTRFEPDALSWSRLWWNHLGVPLCRICLLKLGSYLWPKVESRCRAACKDLQSKEDDTDRENKGPPVTDHETNPMLLVGSLYILYIIYGQNVTRLKPPMCFFHHCTMLM